MLHKFHIQVEKLNRINFIAYQVEICSKTKKKLKNKLKQTVSFMELCKQAEKKQLHAVW